MGDHVTGPRPSLLLGSQTEADGLGSCTGLRPLQPLTRLSPGHVTWPHKTQPSGDIELPATRAGAEGVPPLSTPLSRPPPRPPPAPSSP